MKCVECSRFTLRDSPEMAVHGYGNCARLKPWEYRSAIKEHECSWFEAAKEGDVEKRIAWLEKQKRNG